jgi:phosphoribosylamine---glycine ligase
MNVLIIDSDHVGLDFAMRAANAGHAVRLFRYSKKPTKYATGFGKLFTLVDDWRSNMAWAKEGLILVTANNRYIAELDRFRDLGFTNIFGPTVASARLEIIRSVGMDAMKSIGVEPPPYQTFDSLRDVEAFARKSDRAWVFKPMGDEEDKSLTYVSKDPADLVGWVQRQIKIGKKLSGKAMLQEKIDRLAELGVSGWVGPEGFLPDRWQICFEHKPLMSGDIGPATGETGSVCQYVEKDKLAAEMLAPLESVLRSLGHRGDFAVNCMIDKQGNAHFLEFTARCGYPAWWIQTASHRGDPVRWMKDLLDGKDSLNVSYDVAIGVVMTQPDFPYDNAAPETVEGTPIRGAETELRDLHLVEVMFGKGPVMVDGKVVERPVYETAGTYVSVATGLGSTVERARRRVYATVDCVQWPNRIYRDDIGCKVIDKLPSLHRYGYAATMKP